MRRRLLLALVLTLVLLLVRADTPHFGPARAVAMPYLFSLQVWEGRNFLAKWLHWPLEALPWHRASTQERRALVQDYFATAREWGWLLVASQQGLAPPTQAQAQQVQERMRSLQKKMNALRPRVEEFLEAELSALLKEEGLERQVGPFSLLWPPVDIRFDRLPKLLVISPRDRIFLQDTVLLRGDVPLRTMMALENRLHHDYNLSALVVDLGGLATYPSLISPFYGPYQVTESMAHEWVHHYLYFYPLGRAYYTDPETRALNETVADLVGKELGQRLALRLGYTPPSSQVRGETDFVSQTLRETRQEVEKLLAQGKIEEAEEYMERQRVALSRKGYYLRKLNQAYFAFYGHYAEHPASINPVGVQVRAVREASPSLGAFLTTVARFGSYKDFLEFYQGRYGASSQP